MSTFEGLYIFGSLKVTDVDTTFTVSGLMNALDIFRIDDFAIRKFIHWNSV